MVEQSWGFYILMVVLFFVVGAIIVIIRYFEHKENLNKKDRQPDPLMRSIMAGFVVFAILILAEIVGVEGITVKKYWWIALTVMVSIFLFYIYMLRKKMPMPFEKQFEMVKEVISRIYQADPYIGDAYFNPLDMFMVTRERDSTGNTTEVGNFIIHFKGATVIPYLIKIDTIARRLMKVQHNPPTRVLNKLEEKELSIEKDKLVEEFGTYENDTNEKGKQQ